MMKILAVINVHLIVVLIMGAESMGYKKGDISPLSGSPISDRPPPYCLLLDNNDESQAFLDSENRPQPCVKSLQEFFRALQRSLSGTTAKMSDKSIKLAGLVDVGGSVSKQKSGKYEDVPLAYVPPLDGIRYSRRYASRYWANYSMTFVPFDIQLVSLKQVDPLGSSFTAQWKMLMQWEVLFTNQTYPTTVIKENCSFPCDTTRSNHMCCDNVWVPPLHIPQCNIDSIDSMVDTTPPLFWNNRNQFSDLHDTDYIDTYERCIKKAARCYHRRFWNLNIQTTCDTQMNFHNFPFDTQELVMEIYNPYSSRTWLQFSNQTLADNGANIVNQDPTLDENVPSWHITRVAVSIKCGLPSWRRTFLTQDNFLKKFLTNYTSQAFNIDNALQSLNCADTYKNLEVGAPSVDPSDFSIFDYMLTDYWERFNNTSHNYVECVNKNGTNYTRSPNGASKFLLEEDFLTLFGSWLNVSNSTKISFECLINATANLTTPVITMTITLQRYRRFYVVKLFLPAILCGVFTFAVVALPPEDMKERLQVIVPSALALAALQMTITAIDVPAVSYMIPTSYLVISTYTMQILAALECIAIAKWHKRTKESPTEHPDVNSEPSKDDIHETTEKGQSLALFGASEMVVKRERKCIGGNGVLLMASLK